MKCIGSRWSVVSLMLSAILFTVCLSAKAQLRDYRSLQPVELHGPGDLEHALSAIRKEHATALSALRNAVTNNYRSRIVDFTAKSKLPAMYPDREFVEIGGFMFYGPNFADFFRRASTYVDKILKGAKPADLPIEQPTKFELAINVKTAKQSGLTISQKVLARADRVIK